ncbi:MAG TPA: bifunctional oligoribonuclease/PAP phosphatase NrnA [bacterium]|nr:bifunctional oligoribonuclease/PAP phosphatase NrnA [bacterium]
MQQAIEFIRRHRSFALAAHLNPEGDAIGATLGLALILRAIGKQAYAFNGDGVPAVLRFLPGATGLIRDASALPAAEAVIALDAGDADRPGPEFKKFMHGRPVLNIDHHQTNSRFGQVNWVDPQASSTGEMIAIMAQAMAAPISPDAALCLYTAILTDTGSFQFSNTTPRALRAAADMVALGASPESAADNYYHARPAPHLALLALTMATLEFNPGSTRGDVAVTAAMFKQTGTGPEAAEGVINMITDVESVKVAILFRETDPNVWKVSLRSKGALDVAGLANRHGGGGHKNAAGCKLEGELGEVKKIIREEVEKLLGK